jgi:hypothetical protein
MTFEDGLSIVVISTHATEKRCKPRIKLFFLELFLFFHIGFGRDRPHFITLQTQPFHEYPYPIGTALDPRQFFYLSRRFVGTGRGMFPKIGLQARSMRPQLTGRSPKPDLLQFFQTSRLVVPQVTEQGVLANPRHALDFMMP